MSLDASIPLRGQNLDIATPLLRFSQQRRQQDQDRAAAEQQTFEREQQTFERERQTAIDVEKSELSEAQLAKQKIENLDARQQQRLKSSVIGAAQLDGFLQSGNIEGARSFLQRRRAELGQRIAAGENVDTAETDEAIELLDSDIEQLKGITSSSLEFGKLSGILKRPDGSTNRASALQIADDLQESRAKIVKAEKEGDVEGAKIFRQRRDDIFAVQKVFEKGEKIDDEGLIISAPGALETKEALSGAKETGKLKAKLKLEPMIADAVAMAKLVGADKGLTIVELDNKIANFPRLQTMVKDLDALGEVATYAVTAVLADDARRAAGLEVSLGGRARTEYEAKLRTEIFPLLRDTFGAAFTKAEGDSLILTLGDPKATPEEKKAITKSFLVGRLADIESLKRKAERQGITILPDEPTTGDLSAEEAAELQALEQEFGSE